MLENPAGTGRSAALAWLSSSLIIGGAVLLGIVLLAMRAITARRGAPITGDGNRTVHGDSTEVAYGRVRQVNTVGGGLVTQPRYRLPVSPRHSVGEAPTRQLPGYSIGFVDGRLNRPPASDDPGYRAGYRDGLALRGVSTTTPT
jgi:hypothetical protein